MLEGLCHRAGIGKENVIGGVTEDEFVKKCRGGGRRQFRDEVCGGADKVRLNRREAGLLRPVQHFGSDSVPGIVNVTKCQAVLAVEIVIDSKKFLAPERRCGNASLPGGIAAVRRVRVWNQGQKAGSYSPCRRET